MAAAAEKQALKRLHSDYKNILRSPCPGISAQPMIDQDDWWTWHCTVVAADSTYAGTPFHLVLKFPKDYPNNGPLIWFLHEVYGNYNSSSQDSTTGWWQICMDLSRNYVDLGYHSDWKKQVGTGWSPASNVGGLLVGVQTLFSDSSMFNHSPHQSFPAL